MKLLIIASLLLGSGGIVATQTDLVNHLSNDTSAIVTTLDDQQQDSYIDALKEHGLPYPTLILKSMTPEQQKQVIDYVDTINKSVDFSTMTNEEIKDMISTINSNLYALLDKLQVNVFLPPQLNREHHEELLQQIREYGFVVDSRLMNILTEDQQTAVNDFVSNVNASYDFANMTDEEIMQTLDSIHMDLSNLLVSFGIDLPQPHINHNHAFPRPPMNPDDSQEDSSSM